MAGAVGMIAGIDAGLASDIPLSERRSSYDQMSKEIKEMQDDDTSNPGMLWVLDGAALWARKEGPEARACADCHSNAALSPAPRYDEATQKAVTLDARINLCRTTRQKIAPLAPEARELLALSAYIARQSRGSPIVSDDRQLASTIDKGRTLFTERQGQLNLACVHCHTDNAGRALAGIAIPQGHPTGYPIYRLEWQTLGSLQRRLRNCMIGMRAEPYAYGSDEFVALETYLMWRARGMPIESPGVRP